MPLGREDRKQIKLKLKKAKMKGVKPGQRAEHTRSAAELAERGGELKFAAELYSTAGDSYLKIENGLYNAASCFERSYYCLKASGVDKSTVDEVRKKTARAYKACGEEWVPMDTDSVLKQLELDGESRLYEMVTRDRGLQRLLVKALEHGIDLTTHLERASLRLEPADVTADQARRSLDELKTFLEKELAKEVKREIEVDTLRRKTEKELKMANDLFEKEEYTRCRDLTSRVIGQLDEVIAYYEEKGRYADIGPFTSKRSEAMTMLESTAIRVEVIQLLSAYRAISSSLEEIGDREFKRTTTAMRKHLGAISRGISSEGTHLTKRDIDAYMRIVQDMDRAVKELMEDWQELKARERAEAKAQVRPAEAPSAEEDAEYDEVMERLMDLEGGLDDFANKGQIRAGGVLMSYGMRLAGKLTLKFVLNNATKHVVTDLKVLINTDERIVNVIDVKPDTVGITDRGFGLEIGKIAPGGTAEVTALCDVREAGQVEIDHTLTGKDHNNRRINGVTDYEVLTIKPPDVDLIFRPEEMTTLYLREVMDKRFDARRSIPFLVNKDNAPHHEFFTMVQGEIKSPSKKLLKEWQVEEPSFYANAWYGRMESGDSNYLINIKLDGSKNRLDIHVGWDGGFDGEPFFDDLVKGIDERIRERYPQGSVIYNVEGVLIHSQKEISGNKDKGTPQRSSETRIEVSSEAGGKVSVTKKKDQ